MATAIYISDDLLIIEGQQNYVIPKSHLQNIVTRYIWIKSLSNMDGVTAKNIREFIDLADQIAPVIDVKIPEE
ncbi:MAG: hypothetical protein JXB18_11660 [Sedimentisphaerales bacterium]|nr:hypothetical protein [Sedimentisphaerales bacterium]